MHPPNQERYTSEIITETLIAALWRACDLHWNGIHGISHWQRVRENGLRLAVQTGADAVVVELFAFIHDIKRQNDGRDPDHGARAANWARAQCGTAFTLDDAALALLIYACENHTRGWTAGDITIQTCWDADRLDLGRVGIVPDPARLCTAAARDPRILDWAIRRSQGTGQTSTRRCARPHAQDSR